MRLTERFFAAEKKLIDFRAAHNLYYPDDPRYKGSAYSNMATDQPFIDELDTVWSLMDEDQRKEVDPAWCWDLSKVEEFREAYESAMKAVKAGVPGVGLPGRACVKHGHVCSSEEKSQPRFRCMECMLTVETA